MADDYSKNIKKITEIDRNEKMETKTTDILYGVDDIPPWYLCIPMAFQVHYDFFFFFFHFIFTSLSYSALLARSRFVEKLLVTVLKLIEKYRSTYNFTV